MKIVKYITKKNYKNILIMSGEEDQILKQIKPVIEKLVMDITRQQPQDAVNIFIINFLIIKG